MRKLFVVATLCLSVGLMAGPAVAGQNPTPKPTPKPEVHKEAVKPVTPPPPKTHEVAPGDSLSIIANEEQLESWRPLWDVNPQLADPDLIYAGQQLVVPTEPTVTRPLPVNVAPPVVVRTSVRRAAAPANYAAGAGGVLARIRMRESGGNYATNTGNGYYGAYQFDLRTWQGNGGTGLPSDATPAEQDMRAQMLYDRRGCNPWPNTCY